MLPIGPYAFESFLLASFGPLYLVCTAGACVAIVTLSASASSAHGSKSALHRAQVALFNKDGYERGNGAVPSRRPILQLRRIVVGASVAVTARQTSHWPMRCRPCSQASSLTLPQYLIMMRADTTDSDGGGWVPLIAMAMGLTST